MSFGTYLVRNGIISAAEFVEATEEEEKSRRPLGELALKSSKLTLPQFNQLVRLQSDTRMSFGQAAIMLGFLAEKDLAELLMLQSEQAKSLDTIVVERGFASKDAIVAARRRFYGESPISQAVKKQAESTPVGAVAE